MGSIYGRACFLTRVGGGLYGWADQVEVYSGNSTSWWLGGTSINFGVHARARCLIYPPFVPQQPYSYTGWVSSSSARVLQSTSWACYLAGVEGGFGPDKFVNIYANTTKTWWYLAGYAAAKAGCTSK